MKFGKYFNSWLNLNYYKNYAQIGKYGDFYTSVSIGSLFGIIISKKILSLKHRYKRINLLEIGANNGQMMCDIIQGIYTLDRQILDDISFFVVEPHEKLINIQRHNFHNNLGDEVRVEIVNSIDKLKLDECIIVSNELFDTFECELFDNGKMAVVKDHKVKFIDSDIELIDFAKFHDVSKGELPISYYKFAKNICSHFDKFDFITFDYGDFVHFNEFSVRIFKKHNVFNLFEFNDLSQFYGNCDITYNVNFDILKDAFCQNKGVLLKNFTTQAKALEEFGALEILELFLKQKNPNLYKNALLQFKSLISTHEFGEKFKMVHFVKG